MLDGVIGAGVDIAVEMFVGGRWMVFRSTVVVTLGYQRAMRVFVQPFSVFFVIDRTVASVGSVPNVPAAF